ncbi:MAG: hypothetical protein ACOCV4_02815 [Myxococcota bacterium]
MTRFIEHRTNPLGMHVALWVGFVLVAAAAVVTVVLPELSEDAPEETTTKDSERESPNPQESPPSDR